MTVMYTMVWSKYCQKVLAFVDSFIKSTDEKFLLFLILQLIILSLYVST